MEDNTIIQGLLKRDERSLAHLQTKYGKLMSFVSTNVLSIKEDVEECVNDALLEIWNSIPPQIPRNLQSFSVMITRRLSIDKLRYNTSKKRSAELVCYDELDEVLTDESEISSEELGGLINLFLEGASETDRVIFMQRYYLFMPLEAIAEKLGMTRQNVETRLCRTRAKLKSFLIENGIIL